MRRKSGLINMLFEEGEAIGPTSFQSNHHSKLQQLNQIKKLTQEYMFSPRNRLKYIKIVKINDLITVNQDTKRANSHTPRIFVDGCQLTELLPRRQLATHQYRRQRQIERSYSPEAHAKRCREDYQTMNRSQFCSRQNSYNESIEQDNAQTNHYCCDQTENLETIKIFKKKNYKESNDEDLAVQNSTVSSSNRDFKVKSSVRYRKLSSPQKRQNKNSDKNPVQLKRQIFKLYSNPHGNPQNITAKAYIVAQHFKQVQVKRESRLLFHTALNSKINLEIASLTKIMTCLLTIELCEFYKIDITTQSVKISPFQTNVEGTKAQIQAGQIYTIQQLLFGLMLPSGNDASIALSVFCGALLQNNRKQAKISQLAKQNKISQVGNDLKLKKYFYKKFIFQMNKKCLQLQMKRTFFSNTHGLTNTLNRSCAADTAILIDYALRKTLFRTIVATKFYECVITEPTSEQLRGSSLGKAGGRQRRVKWQNTHKLVHNRGQLYKGIKTGTTQVAGPCLASLIQMNNRQFIIIVLNSKSLKARYKDTERLRQWVVKKQQLAVNSQDL